jgi:spore germination cell wall hydrolase CwlJ-like protein
MYTFSICNIDKSNAANSNSVSDVQLLARAINGEARGESYEGTGEKAAWTGRLG